jgi:hypothetical protein
MIALRERVRGRAWRRERFTLAHEIGHILLFDALGDDRAAMDELRRPENWKTVESLCNFAAAELLSPREHVVDVLERQGFTGSTLGALYEGLQMSWNALLVRLGEILPGASVVTWRHHARPGRQERRTLRVLRSYGGRDGPWLPEGLTVRYLKPDPVGWAASRGAAAEPGVEIALSGRNSRAHTIAISTKQLAPPMEPSLFRQAPLAAAPQFPADVVMLAIDSAAIAERSLGAIGASSFADWRERQGVRDEASHSPTGITAQLSLELSA